MHIQKKCCTFAAQNFKTYTIRILFRCVNIQEGNAKANSSFSPLKGEYSSLPLREGQGGSVYRLGGNSCLSGDWIGDWVFDHELQIGEEIIFEDMIHYTTVKTHMFNGIAHPALGIRREDGTEEVLREFTYEDYLNRMD